MTLDSERKRVRVMLNKYIFKRSKQKGTSMFPSGEYLLIQLRRGRLLIESVCLWVGGVTLKILPPPLLLQRRCSPLFLSIRIVARWSFFRCSRQEKSQSFELEGCVLVRDDLFMAYCAYQGKIIYPWGPPPHQGHFKETLSCGVAHYLKLFFPPTRGRNITGKQSDIRYGVNVGQQR